MSTPATQALQRLSETEGHERQPTRLVALELHPLADDRDRGLVVPEWWVSHLRVGAALQEIRPSRREWERTHRR